MLDVHRFELGAINHVLIVHSIGSALSGSMSFLNIQNYPWVCAQSRE